MSRSSRRQWVGEYEVAELKYWRNLMKKIVVAKWRAPNKEGGKWAGVQDDAGGWYSYDKTKLNLTQGKTYEIGVESKELNGKTYYTITSAKEVAVAAPSASGGGSEAAPWFMPFVSNTVAHAISATLIQAPKDIQPWALAAKRAAEAALTDEPEPTFENDDEPPVE